MHATASSSKAITPEPSTNTATRWHRMCGELPVPSGHRSHAGIATQMLVERNLAAEGVTRHQLPSSCL
jgi:valyl-tRNA synthetase